MKKEISVSKMGGVKLNTSNSKFNDSVLNGLHDEELQRSYETRTRKKKNRKLSVNRLKNKIYNTRELAKDLNCCLDRLYDLNKGGLPHIEGTKNPYLYDGKEVKEYLKSNAKKKIPLNENQSYCCKCQKGRELIPNTIQINRRGVKSNDVELVNIVGNCTVCGTKTNRYSNDKKAEKLYPAQAIQAYMVIQ